MGLLIQCLGAPHLITDGMLVAPAMLHAACVNQAAAAHHGMHAGAKVAYAHDVAPSLCTWQQNRPEACASPANHARLCLASGPAAARADQRGQTLLSLPAMAVTLGAATSLLWAHAIHGTPKVSLPRSGSAPGSAPVTGCCLQTVGSSLGLQTRACGSHSCFSIWQEAVESDDASQGACLGCSFRYEPLCC